MPFSNSETKFPKVKITHEIEEKRNQAEGLAVAVPLPTSWQSANLMALRNL